MGECTTPDKRPKPTLVVSYLNKLHKVNVYTLNDRELATVLASLRHWQGDVLAEMDLEDLGRLDHFQGVRPLDAGEVDELCQKLNVAGGVYNEAVREAVAELLLNVSELAAALGRDVVLPPHGAYTFADKVKKAAEEVYSLVTKHCWQAVTGRLLAEGAKRGM